MDCLLEGAAEHALRRVRIVRDQLLGPNREILLEQKVLDLESIWVGNEPGFNCKSYGTLDLSFELQELWETCPNPWLYIGVVVGVPLGMGLHPWLQDGPWEGNARSPQKFAHRLGGPH